MTVTVRLAPPPPKRILLTGTKPGLEEAALRLRLVRAVSGSPRVKAMAAVEVSSVVV